MSVPFPSALYPDQVLAKRRRVQPRMESPFALTTQVLDWAASRWELSITLPALSAYDAAFFGSWLESLGGINGTFTFDLTAWVPGSASPGVRTFRLANPVNVWEGERALVWGGFTFDAVEALGVDSVSVDTTYANIPVGDVAFNGTPVTFNPLAVPPVSFRLKMLAVSDDDICIKIGGVVVYDPRQNADWYYGAVNGGYAGYNKKWATEGFRDVIITQTAAQALGAPWSYGLAVQVFGFDGWGNSWRTAPWEATLNWSGGGTTVKTGGGVTTGSSAIQRAVPAPDNYYNRGPYFVTYRANGSFTLAT